ncbi:hemerythrin domain-containing protein [Thiocapsa roseopersicina]|uniref:Hemerythrin-like domain-containing protein n=1 Tax=Thiocapsa roseopersicina TaxID=1058 RepID=A0A1H2WDL2_THIRO|nr:hemerythrin domain-containing protein [Thiocapsa roseopersicina]SDW78618.1 Hemerythrin-like domain-containing protein [Thiocapsa roseopersicina]
MHPVMTRLAEDHVRLARLLDLFEDLLNRFHEGAEPDYELMSEMLEYMDNYSDIVHHPTEDIIFERVLDKGTERRDVFDVLMRQHKVLGQLSKRFRQSLDGILHEEVLLREDVEAHGRELIGTLRAHKRLEDEEAFPIALERLSEEDWAQIDAQAPNLEDPLFGTLDPLRYQALYARLSAESRN